MTINGPAEHFLGVSTPGKTTRQAKCLTCGAPRWFSTRITVKKNTKEKNLKTKERKKTSWPERCAALCNLASLKNLVVGEKIFLQKKNTIRKYTTEHTKEMRLNASTYIYPISTYFSNSRQSSFSFLTHFLSSAGLIVYYMLFDIFFSFKIVCPPPTTPFHYFFFIANPMLRGEGISILIFFNHFSRSEYSFQDRCTHQ